MSQSPISASNVPDITTLANKITEASHLQEQGELEQAKELYKEVAEADPDGSLGGTARRAIAALTDSSEDLSSNDTTSELETTSEAETISTEESRNPFQKGWQWFKNRPIADKQLATLGVSEFTSLALVAVSSVFLFFGLKGQLKQQSQSELAVADISYNLKIDQMGFGFKGQADNTAIIQAAVEGEGNNTVDEILSNEIRKRKIEFATLVNPQGKVIEDAGSLPVGSTFNPNNLVTKAINRGEQIKTTERIPDETLKQANPPNLEKFNITQNDHFLIRYTITPVQKEQTIVGVLISGDVVKNPLLTKPILPLKEDIVPFILSLMGNLS